MQHVVGLSGYRGAGKDTAAAYLCKHGYRRTAFADKLYEEVADAFGVTVQELGVRETKETPQLKYALQHCRDERFIPVALRQMKKYAALFEFNNFGIRGKLPKNSSLRRALYAHLSPRQVMQWWGTEYRRCLDGDDYWRRIVTQQIAESPHESFVITDVRFPDEAALVKSYPGGVTANIVKKGVEDDFDPNLLHSSEQAMRGYPFDHTFENEWGPEGLQRMHAALHKTFIAKATPVLDAEAVAG